MLGSKQKKPEINFSNAYQKLVRQRESILKKRDKLLGGNGVTKLSQKKQLRYYRLNKKLMQNYWRGFEHAKADGNFDEAVRDFQAAFEMGCSKAVKLFKVKTDASGQSKPDLFSQPEENFIEALQFHLGIGVAQDQSQAVLLYEEAAKRGDAGAQFNLGYCYLYGVGTEENNNKAGHWLRSAAEQRDADAIKQLKNLSPYIPLAKYTIALLEQDYTEAIKLALQEPGIETLFFTQDIVSVAQSLNDTASAAFIEMLQQPAKQPREDSHKCFISALLALHQATSAHIIEDNEVTCFLMTELLGLVYLGYAADSQIHALMFFFCDIYDDDNATEVLDSIACLWDKANMRNIPMSDTGLNQLIATCFVKHLFGNTYGLAFTGDFPAKDLASFIRFYRYIRKSDVNIKNNSLKKHKGLNEDDKTKPLMHAVSNSDKANLEFLPRLSSFIIETSTKGTMALLLWFALLNGHKTAYETAYEALLSHPNLLETKVLVRIIDDFLFFLVSFGSHPPRAPHGLLALTFNLWQSLNRNRAWIIHCLIDEFLNPVDKRCLFSSDYDSLIAQQIIKLFPEVFATQKKISSAKMNRLVSRLSKLHEEKVNEQLQYWVQLAMHYDCLHAAENTVTLDEEQTISLNRLLIQARSESLVKALKYQDLARAHRLLDCEVDVNYVYKEHYDNISALEIVIGSIYSVLQVKQRPKLSFDPIVIEENMELDSAVTQLLEVLKRLIEKGVNVNYTAGSDFYPLHEAITTGAVSLVQILVEAGANLYERSPRNSFGLARSVTPLALAAFRGQYRLVKYLLDQGAMSGEYDNFTYTAVYTALTFNEKRCTEQFILHPDCQKYVCPNTISKQGKDGFSSWYSPWAQFRDNVRMDCEAVQLFLAAIDLKSACIETACTHLNKRNDEVMALMLTHDAYKKLLPEISQQLCYYSLAEYTKELDLWRAIHAQEVTAVKTALEQGANVNFTTQDCDVLLLSLRTGKYDIVARLISNKIEYPHLLCAAKQKDSRLLDATIGAVNKGDLDCFVTQAIKDKAFEAAITIISHPGCQLSSVPSAVYQALTGNAPNVLAVMIEKGVNIHQRKIEPGLFNSSGARYGSALALAAMYDSNNVLKQLLELGVTDPAIESKDCALICAVNYEQPDSVKQLLMSHCYGFDAIKEVQDIIKNRIWYSWNDLLSSKSFSQCVAMIDRAVDILETSQAYCFSCLDCLSLEKVVEHTNKTLSIEKQEQALVTHLCGYMMQRHQQHHALAQAIDEHNNKEALLQLEHANIDIDVNQILADGRTLLIIAVHQADSESVRKLMAMGAVIERNDYFEQPLLCVTTSLPENEKILHDLLSFATEEDYARAIDFAITHHKYIALNALLAGQSALTFEADFSRHLLTATRASSLEALQIFRQSGIDTHCEYAFGTPLYYAIEKGSVPVVEFFIDRKNIKQKLFGDTIPLARAIKNNDLALVELLISKGAPLGVGGPYGQTLLHLAVKSKSSDIVNRILATMKTDFYTRFFKKIPHINSYDANYNTALHLAISMGSVEIVALLLQHPGVNVNTFNGGGSNPLVIALSQQHTEIAIMLLKHPKINCILACQSAIRCGSEETLIFLFENNYVTTENLQNSTLLHQLMRANIKSEQRDSIFTILYQHGCRLGAKDAQGNTVLHLAIEQNKCLDMIKRLLEHGADVCALNSRGESALFTATRQRVSVPRMAPLYQEKFKQSFHDTVRIKIAALKLLLNHNYYRDLFGEVIHKQCLNDLEFICPDLLVKIVDSINHCAKNWQDSVVYFDSLWNAVKAHISNVDAFSDMPRSTHFKHCEALGLMLCQQKCQDVVQNTQATYPALRITR